MFFSVVLLLYNAAISRLPEAKGLENWIAGDKTGGMTYAISAQEFSSSQEFRNRYGATTTDTKYITTLYNNVLGRSPDALVLPTTKTCWLWAKPWSTVAGLLRIPRKPCSFY